jgi:preprotein translocase subunit SecE
MKNPFRSIRIFWSETITELKKAAWPSIRELRESTVVVLVAVILLGAFIGIADFSLFQVVNLFTDWVRG